MAAQPKFTDVMVDIETTGTLPDRAAMIQLAAVKFNIETGEVDPNVFNLCLTIPPHRSWDESTRIWWQKNPTILKNIIANGQDYRAVIRAFHEWSKQPEQSLRFWSKGSFDFMFVASYFYDEGLPNTFHYSAASDMRTFLRGLHHPKPVPEINVQHNGPAHDAINDVWIQLKTLFAHVDYKEKGIQEAEIVEDVQMDKRQSR